MPVPMDTYYNNLYSQNPYQWGEQAPNHRQRREARRQWILGGRQPTSGTPNYTPTSPQAGNNWWSDWLGDWGDVDARAAGYGSWLSGLRGSPAMSNYYESIYPTMQRRYLGALGNMARSGQAPTMSFTDWLSRYPARRRFQNLPSYQRGYRPPGRMRWLTF